MKKLFLLLLLVSTLVAGSDFTLLPRNTGYTKAFFSKYPKYDGRNVTIFIMDTGVELSLPGLEKNPNGSTKVVDVYDASHCGDVKVKKASIRDIDGVPHLWNKDKYFLKDFEDYKFPEDQIFIGALEEKTFHNKSIKDINGNGKTDDSWVFITYPEKDGKWVMVMDTDMNGSLKGEKIIRNYHKNFDTILLPRKNPLFNHQWMALAVNIYPEKKVVNFHYDDGAHGTHVAGIAAGYHINGDSEVNGLAPGAKVVSVKIGNGSMPGSATVTGSKKRGLEFIEKYMEDHPGYGVINISFGIESSNEGFSDIDKIFNEFCVNNPNVVVCTSAGNEGPGISTVGTPSAAQFAIASGALMFNTTGRDKYGWQIDSPKILHFSSRGGECAKPDVVSPGAMISNVPQWSGGNFYWGTSMSSPYTAGSLAAVLSGLYKEFPKNLASSALVLQGIRETSTKLPEYSVLEQGAGMLNLLPLFNWLKKEIKKPASLHYQVSTETFVPTLPQGKGNSIFWKIYDIDDIPEDNTVTIKPHFNKRNLQKDKDKSFVKYQVKSDAKWVKSGEKNIALLGEQSEDITIRLYPGNVKPNSCRTAKISLIPETKYQNIGQEFWVSVVNPIHFTEENNYTFSTSGQSVKVGETARFFIAVPQSASSMNIKISTDKDKYSYVRTYLFNENGVKVMRLPNLNTEKEVFEVERKVTSELTNGVWELDLYADLGGKQTSQFDLEISFSGIHFDNDVVKTLSYSGNEEPGFSGELFSTLDSYRFVKLNGEIFGYSKKHTLTFGEKDTVALSFHKSSENAEIVYLINMPAKYHRIFTDLIVYVEDKDGNHVKAQGLLPGENEFRLPATIQEGNYTLKFMLAYAEYVEKEVFDLTIEEIHYFLNKFTGSYSFTHDTIYQGLKYPYTIKLSGTPQIIPDGFNYYGKLALVKKDNKILGEKSIRVKYSSIDK